MILRKFNYSISETKISTDFIPAFWIDMSRLYEVYIYSKLHERYGDAIKFQVAGYWRTAVDFVDTDKKSLSTQSINHNTMEVMGELLKILDRSPHMLEIVKFLKLWDAMEIMLWIALLYIQKK